jgi:pimeloyl-ACP methyl ester carboxylesterase
MRDDPEKISAELENINVPVTLIHGQYDPHPIEGILPFLEKCFPEISYHRLADCGHYPWNERQARARFYDIIRTELNGR